MLLCNQHSAQVPELSLTKLICQPIPSGQACFSMRSFVPLALNLLHL